MKNKTAIKSSAEFWLFFLSAILLLRITSYFMVSDSLAVTQLFKVSVRISLSLLLFLLFLRKRASSMPLTKINWLPVLVYGIYLLYGSLSLLWSSGYAASALQLVMDIEAFFFVFCFMQVVYSVQQMHSKVQLPTLIANSVFIIGVAFGVGLFLAPDIFYRLTHGGEVSRLGGFIINPNELGMLLVVGIVSFLYNLISDGKLRIRNLLAISFLVWLLILTGSRSSFSALILVIGVFAITRPGKLLKAALLLAGGVLVMVAGYSVFVKMGDVSEVYSMTGRIPFWKDLLHYNFPREPWFGYGYMRIDYSDKFDSINAYAGAMTHNTFLQVLLGLGLTGLFIVLTQLALFFHATLHCSKIRGRIIFLLFIPLFINSLTEFGIFGETNFGILFYLIINFYAIQEPEVQTLRIKRHVNSTRQSPGFLLRSGDAALSTDA